MVIKMNRKEQKELVVSELVLVGLAVAGLLAVVWFAWLKPAQKSPSGVNSFETCVAAGNPVQESYPEACITPEGGRYVKDAQ